jgi:hypothetical protein
MGSNSNNSLWKCSRMLWLVSCWKITTFTTSRLTSSWKRGFRVKNRPTQFLISTRRLAMSIRSNNCSSITIIYKIISSNINPNIIIIILFNKMNSQYSMNKYSTITLPSLKKVIIKGIIIILKSIKPKTINLLLTSMKNLYFNLNNQVLLNNKASKSLIIKIALKYKIILFKTNTKKKKCFKTYVICYLIYDFIFLIILLLL